MQQLCRSLLRTARRAAQAIHRQMHCYGEEKEAEQKKQYHRLVEATEQGVEYLSQRTEALATRLVTQAQSLLPLVEQVIRQTRRRVFQGEKVVSLVEPHSRAVLRHKAGKTVEFGRQVVFDEVEGDIVTHDEILGHPTEHGQAVTAVEHPPNLVAAAAAGRPPCGDPGLGQALRRAPGCRTHARLSAGVSVPRGHRREDRQPAVGLRVVAVGTGSHGQQPAPDCSSE